MDRLHFLLNLLCCFVLYVSCTGTEDITNNDTESLGGKVLFDLGLRFNKPLLRLVGKSLMNVECKHHPCSEWTVWSSCELFIGKYGMKTRTRQCGGATASRCKPEMVRRQEKQSEVCEEFCPSNYDVTREGFCLRFYNSTTKSKTDAEGGCKNDGGHLININSKIKWEVFSNIMLRNKYTGCVSINGQRKTSSSPWTFTYEEHIRRYTKWASGEPDNSSSELCICAYKAVSGEGLVDVPCTSKYYYMCEIVPA